jgi:hypothetical protein
MDKSPQDYYNTVEPRAKASSPLERIQKRYKYYPNCHYESRPGG